MTRRAHDSQYSAMGWTRWHWCAAAGKLQCWQKEVRAGQQESRCAAATYPEPAVGQQAPAEGLSSTGPAGTRRAL
jgi:hypothetical protein